MHNKNLLIISCLLLSIFSLKISAQIQPVALKINKNKLELEKVIKHYSSPKDSLKKKAAIFLIENMQPHYSYYSKNWDLLCHELSGNYLFSKEKSDYKNVYDSIFNEWELKLDDYILRYDIDTIKAEYLISNIDNSFRVYNQKRNDKVTYQNFCEYILPYKKGNEGFTNWRTVFYNKYNPILNSFYKYHGDSAFYFFCDSIKNHFPTQIHSHYATPDIDPLTMEKLRIGSCFEFSKLISHICAAVGIPVSIDYTPHWGLKVGSHEWNALLIKNSKPLDFGIGDNDKLGEHLKSNEKSKLWLAPKIYRQTYSVNKNGLAYIHGSEEIPELFMDSCFIDVTSEYYKTGTITTDINHNNFNKNYVYLAVSSRNEWIPVCWSKYSKKVSFYDMNTKIVYLPCFYVNEKIEPAGYPVIFKDSLNSIIIKPDVQNMQNVKLYRKFYNSNVGIYNRRLRNTKFQVSNNSNFSAVNELHTIRNLSNNNYQTVIFDTIVECKYFRYLITKGSGAEMAEIELYDSNNNKLSGKIISDSLVKSPESLFDNNTLSYMKVSRSECWAGFEFDKPVQIKKIKYLPRNDDNFIRTGELYELFYWDNNWVSLGKQYGDEKQYLEYKNAPSNALFLLRNRTKGKEERIFTYENGRQIWW